jgi:hypothetical protein
MGQAMAGEQLKWYTKTGAERARLTKDACRVRCGHLQATGGAGSRVHTSSVWLARGT